MKGLVFFIFFLTLVFFSQAQTAFNKSSINPALLNEHVLKEVNKLRKKVKSGALVNEKALSFPAEDHAKYMAAKQKLTHFERKKNKKTPKNRVDSYGALFATVGENVQLNNLNLNSTVEDKLHPLINNYEMLAKSLVATWEKSPKHYANMINPNFLTTYTQITIGKNGEVYACQLFGGSKYEDTYKDFKDTIAFKPDNYWRCWRCHIRPPVGIISVTPDSNIIFTSTPAKFFGIVVPSIRTSRMRFFNPWRDGIAADIVVKSQYPCDTNSYYNGISNIRGVLLKPVYKKDYMGIRIGDNSVVLGKVPSYIKEDFEVNLVVIQNKRPCRNVMYNVIPSDFEIEIPLSYGFEPSEAVLESFKMDTLSKRLYFDKAKIIPRDSLLKSTLELITTNLHKIKKIEIIGFASIDGSTERNIKLYNERAKFLIEQLAILGIDPTQITSFTSENFRDFRNDVKGTKYEYLNKLTDAELKKTVSKKELNKQLEMILKYHRYVDFKIIFKHENKQEYDSELVNKQFLKSLEDGELAHAVELQRIQYGLLNAGKMTLNEIDSVDIPFEKKYIKLLHNRAVMKYTTDKYTLERLGTFRSELSQLIELKKTDEQLNTSIAIIDYHFYKMGMYNYKKVSFYDSIQKWKYLDDVQRARILLNVASIHDWKLYFSFIRYEDHKYWYKKAKIYVEPARLDIDKRFEIASYYSFFNQNSYAYELIKGKIDETENPLDLIFFLKLIHLTNVNLPRTTYLKYFKKIRQYSGHEFCKFFNSPALNFQIFDDPEIKEIYCKECLEQ